MSQSLGGIAAQDARLLLRLPMLMLQLMTPMPTTPMLRGTKPTRRGRTTCSVATRPWCNDQEVGDGLGLKTSEYEYGCVGNDVVSRHRSHDVCVYGLRKAIRRYGKGCWVTSMFHGRLTVAWTLKIMRMLYVVLTQRMT